MKIISLTFRPKISTTSKVLLIILYIIWGVWGITAKHAWADSLPLDTADSPTGTTENLYNGSSLADTSKIKSPPIWPIDTSQFPAVAIKSINPGYNSNGGELIELVRLTDETINLEDLTIRYYNKTGTKTDLYTFPKGSTMIDETIVLRYSSSPEVKEAEGDPELDAIYKKSLAYEAGPLQLVYDGVVFDALCWYGEGCYKSFNSKTPTSLVRNLETGKFQHIDVEEYIASYNAGLKIELEPEVVPEPQCKGLQFSEILTYYETDITEQFIELYNDTDSTMTLDGCNLVYKNKTVNLTGQLEGGDLTVVRPDFTLTKNPSSTNTLEIVDVNGDKVDELVVEHGQKRSASLAQFGYNESGEELWRQTYQQTPGEQNLYQEYRNCEAGKVINETTGNCVKSSTLATTVTECKEGYYRNPETGRCKKLVSSTSQECKAGYERNPETGRCRKIKTNTGADYSLETREYEQKSVFLALGAVIIIVTIGVIYVVFQFRREIKEFFQKLFKKRKKQSHSS